MTGGWNITDYTFTNLGTAFTTGGTQGNSSLNVTITNSTGQLYQRNITGNNTIVTYNWTGLSNGVYAYVINLKSYGGENRNFSLSLNISQPTLGVTTNYCTLTGTVTITGIPNATAINLSITNTTDGTSYWTPDQINYQLKNLGTTTSNKTLLLSTYPQTQNNTYQGKLIFTNTSSGSFIPVITYGPNSSQNNTAVDVSCDGTNYLANVTSGISNACPVVGNLLTYRITLYRNTTSSPTLVSLTINTTDTPVCGNSIQETGEACDLGNSANGACPSTCSASCQTNSCNNGGGGGGGTIVNNPPPVFNNTETNANTSLLDTKTSIITNDNIIKVIAASLAIFIILSIATVVVRR